MITTDGRPRDDFAEVVRRLARPPTVRTGALVAVCGVDGSGKSTLAAALHQELAETGRRATVVRMPSPDIRRHPLFRALYSGDPAVRERVDVFALSLMVMADRLQQLRADITPALAEGQVVICDRYVYTGIVEAAARGVEPLDRLVDIAALFPRPDLAVLTHCPTAVALGRIRARPDEADSWIDEELFAGLAATYHRLARLLRFSLLDTRRGALDPEAVRDLADRVRPAL